MGALPALRPAAHLLPGILSLSICWSHGAQVGVEDSLIHFTGRTMGTSYSVKLVRSDDNLDRSRLAADVERVLDSVNERMSTYLPDSELMRLNSAVKTDWIEISSPLLEVLEEALHWSAKTGGAFDVTVEPLVNLWGFGPRPRSSRVPADPLIGSALRRVGYQSLEIRSVPPSFRKKRPDVSIDLSAIAKGYAVDRVFGVVRGAAVNGCLVEIGGELRGRGNNARGRPWTVAIERPAPSGPASRLRITLSPGAVATSGDYRNFFEKDGRRYSHMLDPRNGQPVQHNLVSVTVVDSTAMRADALATALMVLGAERGYEFAMQENVAAPLSVRNGDHFREFFTTRFKPFLQADK